MGPVTRTKEEVLEIARTTVSQMDAYVREQIKSGYDQEQVLSTRRVLLYAQYLQDVVRRMHPTNTQQEVSQLLLLQDRQQRSHNCNAMDTCRRRASEAQFSRTYTVLGHTITRRPCVSAGFLRSAGTPVSEYQLLDVPSPQPRIEYVLDLQRDVYTSQQRLHLSGAYFFSTPLRDVEMQLFLPLWAGPEMKKSTTSSDMPWAVHTLIPSVTIPHPLAGDGYTYTEPFRLVPLGEAVITPEWLCGYLYDRALFYSGGNVAELVTYMRARYELGRKVDMRQRLLTFMHGMDELATYRELLFGEAALKRIDAHRGSTGEVYRYYDDWEERVAARVAALPELLMLYLEMRVLIIYYVRTNLMPKGAYSRANAPIWRWFLVVDDVISAMMSRYTHPSLGYLTGDEGWGPSLRYEMHQRTFWRPFLRHCAPLDDKVSGRITLADLEKIGGELTEVETPHGGLECVTES